MLSRAQTDSYMKGSLLLLYMIYAPIIWENIPYSGKVLHGTKFRAIHGWVGYRENKNRKILNVCTMCGLNTEKAQK